jgi:ubiquinone biosynthesis protein UbiJ
MDTSAPNAWLPPPLRQFAGRALERALDRALALDPDTTRQLVALEGRSVQIDLQGAGIVVTLTVQDARLRVGPPRADSALRVTATPGSLLAMALRRGEGSMPPGKVEIAGDAELARRLEQLATRFAPDFEEAFAQGFGDVFGVPLARALRGTWTHVRDSATHLSEDAADWLRDEARLAVPRGELDDFLDDVDALRERAERLHARLARLDARRERHGA